MRKRLRKRKSTVYFDGGSFDEYRVKKNTGRMGECGVGWNRKGL